MLSAPKRQAYRVPPVSLPAKRQRPNTPPRERASTSGPRHALIDDGPEFEAPDDSGITRHDEPADTSVVKDESDSPHASPIKRVKPAMRVIKMESDEEEDENGTG